METIQELRNELFKVFEDLRSGKLTPKEATEINNTAGKIINSIKVELAYYALRNVISKDAPITKFITSEDKTQ